MPYRRAPPRRPNPCRCRVHPLSQKQAALEQAEAETCALLEAAEKLETQARSERAGQHNIQRTLLPRDISLLSSAQHWHARVDRHLMGSRWMSITARAYRASQ